MVSYRINLPYFKIIPATQYIDDRGFGWDKQTIIEAQMVFGGLPFFFSLMRSHQSLWENIDRLCLAPRAQLRSETMILLESTMKRSKIYIELFRLLAHHKYGMRKQEACDDLGCSASQFAKVVDEVVKCGYVREYRNLGLAQHPKFLMLVDPFILFHFRFIEAKGEGAPRRWADSVAD